MLQIVVTSGSCDIKDGGVVMSAEFWSNLKIIFEYGGLPAVILVLVGVYLIFVNRAWAKTVSDMQKQFAQQQQMFSQQQAIVLEVVQNNTAAMVTLSTKLGMGCLLFQPKAQLYGGSDARGEKPNV